MIDFIGMLHEFHKKYGHHTQDRPYWPPYDVVRLRDDLIEEETQELLDANTLIEIADALADLLYVTFGAAIAYGIPIEEIFTEVHRSNMTKSQAKNEIGKTIKGENYSPPDVKGIMRAHGLITE